MRKKVTIIGSGAVGSSTAQWIAAMGLADIVMIDIIEGTPQGKALDLSQAMPIAGSDITIKGSNSYDVIKDSDIVIITAGIPRKPGMTREELLSINSKIVENVCNHVRKEAPECILIIVSNPLDAMVYKAWKVTGFRKEKVIGMAGILDSARFRHFISDATGFSVKDVNAMVLGGHGETMVPLKRLANIAGLPLTYFLNSEQIEAIVERTRNGGSEIVGLLKNSSASYAPGRAIAEMVEAILLDKKRVLPCAAYCDNEYGAGGLFIGVPVVLGANGVERVIEVALNDEEAILMKNTMGHVREMVKSL